MLIHNSSSASWLLSAVFKRTWMLCWTRQALAHGVTYRHMYLMAKNLLFLTTWLYNTTPRYDDQQSTPRSKYWHKTLWFSYSHKRWSMCQPSMCAGWQLACQQLWTTSASSCMEACCFYIPQMYMLQLSKQIESTNSSKITNSGDQAIATPLLCPLFNMNAVISIQTKLLALSSATNSATVL